jgi:ribosome-binding factor A
MNNNRPFDRIDKINSLLQQEISLLLQRDKFEHNNPDGDVILSITKVETSRDLKHARIYFAIMPLKFRGDAKKFLKGRAADWQKSLGEKITLKYIPKLQFFYDEGQANAMVVEEILNKLNHDK